MRTESNAIIIPDEIPIAHRLVVFCSAPDPVLGNPGEPPVAPVAFPPPDVVHVGPVIMLLSNVTSPVCTITRPFKVARVFIVIDVDARMFPINELFVPKIDELTSLHHTLHGSPPTTLAVPEVMRSDDDKKIHTPDPLRVSVPVK